MNLPYQASGSFLNFYLQKLHNPLAGRQAQKYYRNTFVCLSDSRFVLDQPKHEYLNLTPLDVL